MINRKTSLTIVCIFALSACQKTNVTSITSAQSVDYFSKNPETAKAVAYKCVDFEKKEYSTLSAGAQKEWQNSADGINCRNAREAATWIVMAERERARSEASRKYGVDAAKK